jgi:hypothetical protein
LKPASLNLLIGTKASIKLRKFRNPESAKIVGLDGY